MGHEVVRCGAVPMPLVGRRLDNVARADLDELTAPGLDEALSFGDIEGLADGVRMPGRPGVRREVDRTDPDARGLLASYDAVDPDVPGKPLRWTFGRRRLGLDLHGHLLTAWSGEAASSAVTYTI